MMFGSKRRNAVQAAVENVRPIIASTQHNFGLPAGFWTDEYILGFIGFMIGFHMEIASNGKLSQIDKGRVLSDVFTRLSNMNGSEIARQYTDLCLADSGDYKTGADNAALIAFYSIGRLRNENDNPHVIEAKEMANNAGSGGDRSTIMAMLMLKLFTNEVIERSR